MCECEDSSFYRKLPHFPSSKSCFLHSYIIQPAAHSNSIRMAIGAGRMEMEGRRENNNASCILRAWNIALNRYGCQKHENLCGSTVEEIKTEINKKNRVNGQRKRRKCHARIQTIDDAADDDVCGTADCGIVLLLREDFHKNGRLMRYMHYRPPLNLLFNSSIRPNAERSTMQIRLHCQSMCVVCTDNSIEIPIKLVAEHA